MKRPATAQTETTLLPLLSSQAQGWEHIQVEQFQHPSGEAWCHYNDEHLIYLSLAPRPIRLQQFQEGQSYTGLYTKGHISIMPAKTPVFARWQGDDYHLQIRIASSFIQNLAREVMDLSSNQLEFLPNFRTRDPQIESIGMMLLSELQQENLGGKLYITSLANLLSVHLLRQYATSKPRVAVYAGGLSERQLSQVFEYINEQLHLDIGLADLAQVLGLSQYHFSHLFKQSLGVSPYQFLLQQRIERAKQLLKQTDRSIMEIALDCGFSSHSHLSKQFRQVAGVTPKAYRASF